MVEITFKDLKCKADTFCGEADVVSYLNARNQAINLINSFRKSCKECTTDEERRDMEKPEEFLGYCVECEGRKIGIGLFMEFFDVREDEI